MVGVTDVVISVGITVFSFGLLFVSLLSYSKYRNIKLLFIGGVFLVLLVKGVLLSLGLFFTQFSSMQSIIYGTFGGVFDIIILGILFIATLKR